jgi:hypothetical protein
MEKEALESLIFEQYRDLVKSKVYIQHFKKEMRNPKKMGVQQAKESLEVWEKHLKTVQGNIELYKDYKLSQKYGK